VDKEQRQVVVICAVRVYNDGMNNPNIVEVSGTLTIEKSRVSMIFNDDDLTCKVKIIGEVAPHTCEHCKFYGKFSGEMTDCINEHVNYLVDYLAINKDFGCIFWEGKE
jgi:hypothetical protein